MLSWTWGKEGYVQWASMGSFCPLKYLLFTQCNTDILLSELKLNFYSPNWSRIKSSRGAKCPQWIKRFNTNLLEDPRKYVWAIREIYTVSNDYIHIHIISAVDNMNGQCVTNISLKWLLSRWQEKLNRFELKEAVRSFKIKWHCW